MKKILLLFCIVILFCTGCSSATTSYKVKPIKTSYIYEDIVINSYIPVGNVYYENYSFTVYAYNITDTGIIFATINCKATSLIDSGLIPANSNVINEKLSYNLYTGAYSFEFYAMDEEYKPISNEATFESNYFIIDGEPYKRKTVIY